MSERDVLSEVFPAHADLQPILKKLREKYSFPEFDLADQVFAELLLAKKDFPWEDIQRDIHAEVMARSELFPEQMQFVRRLLQNQPEAILDPEKFAKNVEITENDVRAATTAIFSLIKPIAEAYLQVLEDICRLTFVYLTTGKSEQIPLGWLGAVYTTPMLGQPVVVAMASHLSNPDEIIERFTVEIHKTFGRNRPKISGGMKSMAKYLRKRFEGVSLTKLADEHIKLHPKEFTGKRNSPSFRDYRRGIIERLKKSLKRYEKKIYEIIGDNSKP